MAMLKSASLKTPVTCCIKLCCLSDVSQALTVTLLKQCTTSWGPQYPKREHKPP